MDNEEAISTRAESEVASNKKCADRCATTIPATTTIIEWDEPAPTVDPVPGGVHPVSADDFNKQCALCGHDYPCGSATVDEGGETLFLCHTDSHSCYHLWTVYGLRPVDERGGK